VLDQSDTGGPKPFFLLPENQRALTTWLALQTQWVHAGMGQPTGLNYAGVEAYLRLARLDRPPRRARQLLADIQRMERVTLHEWADRARRERPASARR
jgi:hypothetical protein